MPLVSTALAALAWLGRQGTRAVAALVFIGIAVPPLGALFKPFVTEAIFVLLSIAFLRLDGAALGAHLGRPAVVLAATLWTMLAMPAIFGAACLLAGLDARSPALFLALMMQAVAAPMMAAPAFAALMGLDATLVLIALVASTALTPLTAPLFAHAFLGEAATIAPLALGLKLFAILAGSALLGGALRRLAGAEAIRRHAGEIDGFNILILFVFIGSVMESVAASAFARPWLVAGLGLLAFAVYFAILGLTWLVFARAGRERALALALMTSQRNMGLMLAATGGALPDLAWLYFALGQFPIYLTPHLLKPLARLIVRRG